LEGLYGGNTLGLPTLKLPGVEEEVVGDLDLMAEEEAEGEHRHHHPIQNLIPQHPHIHLELSLRPKHKVD